MTRTILPLALLFLAACDQPQAPPTPAPTPTTAPVPVAKAVVPSLEGKWRVTTPASLDLTIGKGFATLSSGCVRRGFTFRQDRNSVAFVSAPAGSSNCEKAPTAPEEAAFAALTDTNLAIFAKDGRTVTLSGLGGMLALERR